LDASEAEFELVGLSSPGPGVAAVTRIGVRVHAVTSGGVCAFRKDEKSYFAEAAFSDVLKSAAPHVVVWDLSRVRSLSSMNLSLALTAEESAGVESQGKYVVSVETFENLPPVSGEQRASYFGLDERGVPVEVPLMAVSGSFVFDNKQGVISVKSTFPTVAPRGVQLMQGRYYYEVTVVKCADGVAQMGFCDALFSGDNALSSGTGDCKHSWGFDGSRVRKWNGEDTVFGKKWKDGDVVGCAIDIDKGDVFFSLNGSWKKPMGLAFSGVDIL
jgi:hypothetical protein